MAVFFCRKRYDIDFSQQYQLPFFCLLHDRVVAPLTPSSSSSFPPPVLLGVCICVPPRSLSSPPFPIPPSSPTRSPVPYPLLRLPLSPFCAPSPLRPPFPVPYLLPHLLSPPSLPIPPPTLFPVPYPLSCPLSPHDRVSTRWWQGECKNRILRKTLCCRLTGNRSPYRRASPRPSQPTRRRASGTRSTW